MTSVNRQTRKKFGKGEILEEASPEQASSLFSCLEDLKVKWKKKQNLASIWQDWPQLVGKQIANNCLPISLKGGILVIGSSHPQWRQAIQYNRPQLVAAFRAAGHEVKDIRIKQHYRKATPSLETEKAIWGKHPSRTDIHGIAQCNYCKTPSPAGEMALWGKCGFCRRKDLAQPF